MIIDLIVGARPNFIKISELTKSLDKQIKTKSGLNYRLVHTGQHYNSSMSKNFFRDLDIKMPDINLKCGSGSQAEQTGRIMQKYEKLLKKKPCKLCIVVGDVNSTMACAIAAKKLNIKVAHIEGGLRSHDMSMPEEINRIITDSITDYFFTTTQNANKNLIKEGHSKNKIFFVGNLMIDTLIANMSKLNKSKILDKINVKKKQYLVMTIHRPQNTDKEIILFNLIEKIHKYLPNTFIIFSMHPRIQKYKKKLENKFKKLICTEPQSYLDFIYLIKNSKAVITDSGGITEEASVMSVPCLTLRSNTERPETIIRGTNVLVGNDEVKIRKSIKKIINGKWKQYKHIKNWDGKTSDKIVKILKHFSTKI